MIQVLAFMSIFFVTYFGVELFRRWSIRKKILDIPNERSSHQIPTPRGGGLIIVLVTLLSFFLYQNYFSERFFWSYFCGAILIAAISLLDDIYSLGPIWRFLCHITAAVLIIWQFGYWQTIYLPFVDVIGLGITGSLISIVWIVWLTNAYNFMDGIDGIASLQAISASIGWFLLGYIWNLDFYAVFGLILLFSNLGFILHNWQPAKIFMGDVGSAFLGYTFAVLPFFIKTESVMKTSDFAAYKYIPIIGILFVWLFAFDTFITLFRRVYSGDKIWKPHRRHLYQMLIKQGYKHSFVSAFYGMLSMVLVLVTIYCLVLNKYELILITLTLLITNTLVLFVYKNKLLTKVG